MDLVFLIFLISVGLVMEGLCIAILIGRIMNSRLLSIVLAFVLFFGGLAFIRIGLKGIIFG